MVISGSEALHILLAKSGRKQFTLNLVVGSLLMWRDVISLGVKFAVPFGRVVRSTGPNWCQVVLDICIKP